MKMNRKTFIEKSVGAMMVALPAYALIGCSSSDNGGDPNPNPNPNPDTDGECLANGTNTAISANHGHNLTVSVADVTAGNEKSYSIQGSSGHDHMVTITGAQFSTLQDNNSVVLNSTSGDGHVHSGSWATG
jgi:hypothetical protein